VDSYHMNSFIYEALLFIYMPYCSECGVETNEGAQFCPECGAEQGDTIQTEEGTPGSPDKEDSGIRHNLPGISPKNRTRRNVLIGSGYAIAGLVTLGAIGGNTDEGSSGGSDGGSGGTGSDGGSGGTGSDSGSGGTGGLESEYPNAFAIDENNKIVLESAEGAIEEFSVEITGTAINASDQDYGYVQLEFGLYDSTDAKVGDALANTSGLESGQRWRFEAIGTDTENTDIFRLEDVTAT
jgi:hypothetical protein